MMLYVGNSHISSILGFSPCETEESGRRGLVVGIRSLLLQWVAQIYYAKRLNYLEMGCSCESIIRDSCQELKRRWTNYCCEGSNLWRVTTSYLTSVK
jgi:hypothetical protein